MGWMSNQTLLKRREEKRREGGENLLTHKLIFINKKGTIYAILHNIVSVLKHVLIKGIRQKQSLAYDNIRIDYWSNI